jgi:hypothetical protein
MKNAEGGGQTHLPRQEDWGRVTRSTVDVLSFNLEKVIMADLEQLFTDIETVLERMIAQQRDKVREVALDIVPHLRPEELDDPHDHAEVADDAMFNFEDGTLAGLMSARQALRTAIFAVYRAQAGADSERKEKL